LALDSKSFEKMQLGDGLVAGSYLDSKRRVLVDFIGLVVELDHETSIVRVIWTPKSVRLQISEQEIDANSWNGSQLFIINDQEIPKVQFTILFSELNDKHDTQEELANHGVSSAKISNNISAHRVEDPESMVDILAEAIFWVLYSSKKVMDVPEIAKTLNANTGIVRQLLIKNNLILYKQLDYFAPANWARNWSVNWVAIENRLPVPGIDYEEYVNSRRHTKEVFKSLLIDYFLKIEKSVKVTTISKELNIDKDEIQIFLDLEENHQVFRKFGSYNYQLKDFCIPLFRERASKQKSRINTTHEISSQISQQGNSKSISSFSKRRPDANADFGSFFVIPNRQEKLEKLEERIEKVMQLVAGESLSMLDLKSIEFRMCPNCGRECFESEKNLSIFCSLKCVKGAERRYLKQLTNEHRLKLVDKKSIKTLTGIMVEGDGTEISVVKAIEIVVNWLVNESGQNVSDSSIWMLIDDFKRRKISYIDRTKIDGLTVMSPDLVKLMIDLKGNSQSENEYKFPLRTESILEELTRYSDNPEVRQFVKKINEKRFLNSIRFIDRFTLCYFGAPSVVLEAAGERVFLDTDRLKSWIYTEFEDKSEELLQFADELCFASSCIDFWPNMSILVYPWIDFDPTRSTPEVIQKKFLSQLILSITSANSKSKSQMLQWLRELVFFYFELEAPKARTARGRYSETFQVSRERARQISHASKPLLDYLRRYEKEIHDVGEIEGKDRLSKYIWSHPGSTITEIDGLFIGDASLRRWFDRNYGHLILNPSVPSIDLEASLKRVDVLESLRAASTLYWPLTTKKYEKAINSGFVSGVSKVRIMQIFGTWKNACDEAGVECGETLRGEYTREFSSDECIKFVGDYLMDDGYKGNIAGYGSWRENHQTPDRVPSYGTLLNRLSRDWAIVTHLALESLRNQWLGADLEDSPNGH
jgi:hypothetical protein